MTQLNTGSVSLQREWEAIKRDRNQEKLKSLNDEIGNLIVEQNRLKAKWQLEIYLVEQIQSRKNEIQNLKFEAVGALCINDLGKVAEVRYDRIPED